MLVGSYSTKYMNKKLWPKQQPTTFIQGLCESGKFDDAVNLVQEMLSHDVSPDVMTACTLQMLSARMEDYKRH